MSFELRNLRIDSRFIMQNILTFTPPGFKQILNVKFPDSRLAVCEKCKKNFKTRDMCRVRNTHTTAPWTTAYICVTLDDSCTDADGKYIEAPLTVRMVQWQPFCVKTPFDPKTPVCAACKKTNRTRSFCRERHKHRQLPWCTVYVLLSALEAADPATVVAGPSKPLGESSEKKGGDEDKSDEGKEEPDAKSDAASPTNAGGPDESASAAESKNSESVEEASENVKLEEGTKSSQDDEDGDDINDISESRTFLAKVCCKKTTIHWLELAEYENADATGVHGMLPPDAAGYVMNPAQVPGVDPNHYYAHAMGYAAQQHQNTLKNHQQYFFQMQQRHQQHYAAQQAAWQAQYSQQAHMQMQSGAPQQLGLTSDNGPTPAPVTAGEAAAQQQKRNRETAPDGNGQHRQPPPGGGVPPQHQSQPGQQQQWMLYQQMYQAQLPPMPPQAPQYASQPARLTGQQQQDSAAAGMHGALTVNTDQQYEAQVTSEANGKGNHEIEASKRQRLN